MKEKDVMTGEAGMTEQALQNRQHADGLGTAERAEKTERTVSADWYETPAGARKKAAVVSAAEKAVTEAVKVQEAAEAEASIAKATRDILDDVKTGVESLTDVQKKSGKTTGKSSGRNSAKRTTKNRLKASPKISETSTEKPVELAVELAAMPEVKAEVRAESEGQALEKSEAVPAGNPVEATTDYEGYSPPVQEGLKKEAKPAPKAQNQAKKSAKPTTKKKASPRKPSLAARLSEEVTPDEAELAQENMALADRAFTPAGRVTLEDVVTRMREAEALHARKDAEREAARMGAAPGTASVEVATEKAGKSVRSKKAAAPVKADAKGPVAKKVKEAATKAAAASPARSTGSGAEATEKASSGSGVKSGAGTGAGEGTVSVSSGAQAAPAAVAVQTTSSASTPTGRYSAAAAFGMAEVLGDAIAVAEEQEEPEEVEERLSAEAAGADELDCEALVGNGAGEEAAAPAEGAIPAQDNVPAAAMEALPEASMEKVGEEADSTEPLDPIASLDDHDEAPLHPVFEPLDGRRRRAGKKTAEVVPDFKDVTETLHPKGAPVPADVARARMLVEAGAVTAEIPNGVLADEVERIQAEWAGKTVSGQFIPPTSDDIRDSLEAEITAASMTLYPTAARAPIDPAMDPAACGIEQSGTGAAESAEAAEAAQVAAAEERLRIERELAAIEKTKRELLPAPVDHWFFRGADGVERTATLTEAMTVLTPEETEDVYRRIQAHLDNHTTVSEAEVEKPGAARGNTPGVLGSSSTDARRDASVLTILGLGRRMGAICGTVGGWTAKGIHSVRRGFATLGLGKDETDKDGRKAPSHLPIGAGRKGTNLAVPTSGLSSPSDASRGSGNLPPAETPSALVVPPQWDAAQRTERMLLAVIAMVSCGALGLAIHAYLTPEPTDVVVDRAMVESAVAMMRIAQSRPGMPERPELAALTRDGIDEALEKLAREQNLRIYVKGAFGAMPEGPMPDVTDAVLASIGITPIERKVLADAVTHHWLMQPAEEDLVQKSRLILRPELQENPLAQEIERLKTEGLTPLEAATRDPRLLEPARMRAEARAAARERQEAEIKANREAEKRAAVAEGLTEHDLPVPIWDRIKAWASSIYEGAITRGVETDPERKRQRDEAEAERKTELENRIRE